MSKLHYYQICNDCQYEEVYPCNAKTGYKSKEKCDQCGSHDIFIVNEQVDE